MAETVLESPPRQLFLWLGLLSTYSPSVVTLLSSLAARASVVSPPGGEA